MCSVWPIDEMSLSCHVAIHLIKDCKSSLYCSVFWLFLSGHVSQCCHHAQNLCGIDGYKLLRRTFVFKTETDWKRASNGDTGKTYQSSHNEYRIRRSALHWICWHHQWFCCYKIQKSVWPVNFVWHVRLSKGLDIEEANLLARST